MQILLEVDLLLNGQPYISHRVYSHNVALFRQTINLQTNKKTKLKL